LSIPQLTIKNQKYDEKQRIMLELPLSRGGQRPGWLINEKRKMKSEKSEPALFLDLESSLSMSIPQQTIKEQKYDDEQLSLFGEGERRRKGLKVTFSRK
jgi:hypothetical protein